MKWSKEQYDRTFEFRARTWYTEAITSPKDIIILLDASGSMKGKRRTLTKYIVNNILDTLYDNDFVNIFTVSNVIEPLIQCFDYELVQANEENLRLFREGLDNYKTRNTGNIVFGIKKAFKVLERYKSRKGGNC